MNVLLSGSYEFPYEVWPREIYGRIIGNPTLKFFLLQAKPIKKLSVRMMG